MVKNIVIFLKKKTIQQTLQQRLHPLHVLLPPPGHRGPPSICSTTTILVSTTKHPPRSSTINPDGDFNCPGSHTKRCYLKWNLCPSGTSKEFASLMNTSVSGKLILNALAASSQFGEGTPGVPSPPLKISVVPGENRTNKCSEKNVSKYLRLLVTTSKC